MNKLDIFEYLNSGVDKSGNLKKIGGFKKHFPEIYDEFLKEGFPIEIENLPFKQKLWHFLNDVYEIPTCLICNNPVSFLTRKGQWGYSTYCSGSCAMQDNDVKQKLNDTKEERYGNRKYNNSEKQKETLSYKDENFWTKRTEKSIETRQSKNGGNYFSQDSLNKIKDTTRKNWGEDCFARTSKYREIIKNKHDEIQDKQFQTKSKNNSFNKSKIENDFEDFLNNIGIPYIHQYKSEIYPYVCDFYIPTINLYIEIQGNWTHGLHPFNPNDSDDIDKLNTWKEKNTKYYNQAIYVWTDLDIRKRTCAISNNLNYLEIFSNDINTCVDLFTSYLSNLISTYCLSSPFPGSSKWEPNHPIWECNVGNRKSPKEAWVTPKYVKKAVDNLLKMVYRDEPLRNRFLKELSTCIIQSNKIISSSVRFLQLVLDRFTIAKIAPKVTALSPKTLLNILDESGIDLSLGVYIPMAGFGGIVRGYEQWCEKHGQILNCECYDINPDFCEWYGWTQKDMLSEHVKTNKVCICCPPFGKDFEHWKNTPRDMSEKSFKEWYKLIKEHVQAPHYIIIGPEIKSKNDLGLFAKKVGVMLWTDEMIEKI